MTPPPLSLNSCTSVVGQITRFVVRPLCVEAEIIGVFFVRVERVHADVTQRSC